MDIMERIQQQIDSAPIVLYMKGTPQFPQCGFSAHTVEVLKSCDAPFAHVDVLADPEVRANLPRYANWPTFPQLYIDGDLVGGCDIVVELYQRGELQPLVNQALGRT
jgi:monothiol glutaredoxin